MKRMLPAAAWSPPQRTAPQESSRRCCTIRNLVGSQTAEEKAQRSCFPPGRQTLCTNSSPRMPTVIFATRPYLEPLLDGIADFARVHKWNLVSSMRRSGRFPSHVQPDAILATVAESD